MNLNTDRQASKLKRRLDESPEISEERPGKARKTAPIGEERHCDLDRGNFGRENSARRFTGVRSGHAESNPRMSGAAAPSSTSFTQHLFLTAPLHL